MLPDDIRIWAEQHIGKIQLIQPLKGGISTSVYHLKTEQNAYVLRVIDRADWLAIESDLAPHEAAALKAVADLDVPTPQLIAFDNAEACSIPVVLSTWLPGKLLLMPHDMDTWLKELAQTLAKIHQLDVPDFQWTYESWVEPEKFTAPPDWTQFPDLWRKAASILHQPPPNTPIRLIHRDYHPANVLFQDGRISAVVDWINACRGAVSIDVAICRHDLVCFHGIAAANQFQTYYETAMGISHHPLWDLRAMLEFFSIDLKKVYVLWHDLGMEHLTESILHQRADAYLVDIMKRL